MDTLIHTITNLAQGTVVAAGAVGAAQNAGTNPLLAIISAVGALATAIFHFISLRRNKKQNG